MIRQLLTFLALAGIVSAQTPSFSVKSDATGLWNYPVTAAAMRTANGVAASGANTDITSLSTATFSGNSEYQFTVSGGSYVDNVLMVRNQSAQLSNPKTISSIASSVFTSAAHGKTNGDPVQFATTSTFPTGITAFTDYEVRDVTTNTFTVAAYHNGPAVTGLGSSWTGTLTASDAQLGFSAVRGKDSYGKEAFAIGYGNGDNRGLFRQWKGYFEIGKESGGASATDVPAFFDANWVSFGGPTYYYTRRYVATDGTQTFYSGSVADDANTGPAASIQLQLNPNCDAGIGGAPSRPGGWSTQLKVKGGALTHVSLDNGTLDWRLGIGDDNGFLVNNGTANAIQIGPGITSIQFGATISGITFGGPVITGTWNATPVLDTYLAASVKPAVAVIGASNLTLSGEQTIDGVTTSTSLVLATAQTTASQNGPWLSGSGAWTRPGWYTSGSTLQAPQFLTTFVRLGTTYQGSTWRMTTAGVTIDTTSTTWVQTPTNINSTTGTLSGSSVSGGTFGAVNGSALTALTAANITASTTVGRNALNVTNPGAISFIKIAADNSVSTRTPAQVLSDIGAQASGSYAASPVNGDLTSLTALNAATTTNLVKPIARQTFSNAAASVIAGNNVVEQTGTMSASRPLTLAAANAYTAGDIVKIVDKSCTVTIANTIVITRAGSDTINYPGTAGATTLAINNPGGSAWIESDGVSQWTLIAGNPGTLTLGSGTLAAPALTLRNYGLFEDTVTVGGLATWAGGNTLSIINGASYRVQNGCSFQWSSTTSALGSTDTGISRDSAGVIDFGNGTAADKSATLKAAGMNLSGLTASRVVVTDASKNLISGTGNPAQIVASGDFLAQTATKSSVATYTTPNDATVHSFLVGGYANVTAISAGTLTMTVTFTDENNAAQTLTYFGMGLTSAGITATGFTGFAGSYIRCKANTAITFVATFAGVSITYDVGSTIQSLY